MTHVSQYNTLCMYTYIFLYHWVMGSARHQGLLQPRECVNLYKHLMAACAEAIVPDLGEGTVGYSATL